MNRRQILAGSSALAVIGGGTTAYTIEHMGSRVDYDAAISQSRATLGAMPTLGNIIRVATLAPSGHNAQPWRFQLNDKQIVITPDFTRRTPVVDPDNHHLFVSLGCAAETLALAAHQHGYAGQPIFSAANGGAINFNYQAFPPHAEPLYEAINKRQSSRTLYDGKPITSAELKLLAASAAVDNVEIVLLTERMQRDQLRDIVIAGNTAQMADPNFVRELKQWIRFNPRQAMRMGDGLYSAASGNPILPTWLGEAVFERVFRVVTENDKYATQLNSSPAIAVFVGAHADPENWVKVGRACQRFALQATTLGIQCAFINQAVEVPSVRPELAALIGMTGRRPDIVMRFGRGPMLPFSLRRPIVYSPQGTVLVKT